MLNWKIIHALVTRIVTQLQTNKKKKKKDKYWCVYIYLEENISK